MYFYHSYYSCLVFWYTFVICSTYIVHSSLIYNSFNINTVSVDSNMYITSNELNIGKYTIIVRDTSMLKTGEYFVDITYVSADGFRQSIETVYLKVMDRI